MMARERNVTQDIVGRDDKPHSRFGASAAHRWMRCPGSVQASAGLPNPSTPFAEEGTMLHEVAANRLLGLSEETDLTDDQENVVRTYVAAVRAEIEEDSEVFIEAKFKLPHHDEFWGTADAVVATGSKLRVLDLKAGRGVAVEVDYGGHINPQLGFYALGAIAFLGGRHFDDIEVIVVQPRLGGIKRRRTSMGELNLLARELVDAARVAESDNPPLSAGSHCKFCLARKTCSELASEVLRTAQMDFADESPTPVDVMSVHDLANVLNKADVIETWLKAVRDLAHALLTNGEPIPGWKLVPKRSIRKWKDERMVKQRLASEGLSNFLEEKLVSPAQAEKLAKKQGIQLDLFDLLDNSETGTTLARETDKRVSASASAGNDFAD